MPVSQIFLIQKSKKQNQEFKSKQSEKNIQKCQKVCSVMCYQCENATGSYTYKLRNKVNEQIKTI